MSEHVGGIVGDVMGDVQHAMCSINPGMTHHYCGDCFCDWMCLDCGWECRGDVDQVRARFRELLNNAAPASYRGTVEEAVKLIELVAEDPEVAHSLEDQLWRFVLEILATELENPLAVMALKTRELRFPRWAA
jgi:hypothetical protein